MNASATECDITGYQGRSPCLVSLGNMCNLLKIAHLIFPIILGTTFVWAQQPITATTEDGRKILVYPDGTWRLFKQTGAEHSTGTFEKSPNAFRESY